MRADPHDWDMMSAFCIRCGCSMEDFQDRRRDVFSPENVIAISHILCRKKMAAVVEAFHSIT